MLEIQNLSMSYGDYCVLNNINLVLESGNIYGLVGVNGCGKTSLLNALAKFTDYIGTVSIDEIPIIKFGRKELAKKISYMRQNPNISFSHTIEEIVNMSQYVHGFGKRNEGYIDEIMKICELEGIKEKNILSISGGQRQRVFFAKTLAQNSEIILIDEGFSNIDIYYQIKFMSYLNRLALDKNKTILIVIHDINFAMQTINKMIVFKDGLIYDQGKTVEVITEEMMKNVFNVDIKVSSHGIDYNNIKNLEKN